MMSGVEEEAWGYLKVNYKKIINKIINKFMK